MAINKISDSNYKTSFNYKVHNLHMSEDADVLEEKIVEQVEVKKLYPQVTQ
jgi:hypothetical protein